MEFGCFFKILLYCLIADSPSIVKENSHHVLKSKGGEGVLIELYDLFISKNWINEPTEESVADLDKKEISSKEME